MTINIILCTIVLVYGFMKDYILEDYKSPRSCRVKYVFGMNAADSVRGDYHHSINLIFIFFIRGKGNINIEGASYEFNEGDVIMLNPSEFFLCNIDNNILRISHYKIWYKCS